LKGSLDYKLKAPNTGKNVSNKVSNVKLMNKDFYDPYSEQAALIKDPPVGGYLNA
jgi:hypothetical protein